MTTKYNLLPDERITAHKRVFVRWLNTKLSQTASSVEVQHLVEDLQDGRVLLSLVDVLWSSQEHEQRSVRDNPQQNVQKALEQLEQNKVEMLGITNADIVDGKEPIVLELLWNVIWRFQLQAATTAEASDDRLDKTLLHWCRERLKSYSSKVTVHNFNNSWRDGLALNALLHSFRPSLFAFDTIMACDVHTRLSHAFNIANMEFGVPCYLEPRDVDRDDPDEMLIKIYLACLYQNTNTATATEANGHVTVASDHVEKKSEARVLHVSGFPNVIRIERAKTCMVSPLTSLPKISPTREHKRGQLSPVSRESPTSKTKPFALRFANSTESQSISFTKPNSAENWAAEAAGQHKRGQLSPVSRESGPTSNTKPFALRLANSTESQSISFTKPNSAENRAAEAAGQIDVNFPSKFHFTDSILSTKPRINEERTVVTEADRTDTTISEENRVVTEADRTDTTVREEKTVVTEADRTDTTIREENRVVTEADRTDTTVREEKTVVTEADRTDTTIREENRVVTEADRTDTTITGEKTVVTGADRTDTTITGEKTVVTGAGRTDTKTPRKKWPERSGQISEDTSITEIEEGGGLLCSLSNRVKKNSLERSDEALETKPTPSDSTFSIDKEMSAATAKHDRSPCSSSSSLLASVFSSAEEDLMLSFSERSDSRRSSSTERFTTCLTIHFNERSNTHGRIDFVEYLGNKLEDLDRCLSAKEMKIMDTDLDSMDLKAAKQSLDYHKELVAQLDALEPTIDSVLGEGRDLVRDEYFDDELEIYFNEKMNNTEGRLRILQANMDKEQQRLFDIYSILMSQHVDRMNDWLLRAEATVALYDDVDPTYEEVKTQVQHHEKFMTDLADHSMVNVIFEMDMEVTLLDEHARDWVKVLSERWAAVWTWAEEWKHTLSQVLNDWQRFRTEQKVLLNWLTSKEETLGIMGQTDITNVNQVLVHQNLLKTVQREMFNQERRLESLHESADQLIRDAGYHNSTAKNIRDQVKDFDDCWDDIRKKVQRRHEQLNGAKDRLKQIGSNLKEVREWMKKTEAFLHFIKNDGNREDKAHSTIEQMCEERERNQLKVKYIYDLSKELAEEVDKASQDALQRVLTPFHKRWKDINESLNSSRNDEYSYIRAHECFLVKFLRRNLSMSK